MKNPYDQFICINDKKLLEIENKYFSFSLDKNYNYASCIIESNNKLPKLNINLSLLKKYLMSEELNEDLFIEIVEIKKMYDILKSNLELEKENSIRYKSTIFYLFHIMNYSLFYILLKPRYAINFWNYDAYLLFFKIYYSIKHIAESLINKNINKNNINHVNIFRSNDDEFVDEYYELINYKEEFKDIVYKLNYLLTIIINIFGYPLINRKEENKIDETSIDSLKQFMLVFNIFYSINEKYNIIDYKCFYNDYLSKYLDIKREFQIYLNNKKNYNRNWIINDNLEFTLLSYTWLFNPSTKYEIIKLYNIIKQIKTTQNLSGNQLTDLNAILSKRPIYLEFEIKRDNLIEETFNLISRGDVRRKLHYPLRIRFVGEEAEDQGGVRKEFFMIIKRELFDPNYGMFTYNEKTRLFWFNINNFEETIKYELIGIIVGLALYNQVILDINFPHAIYKKLLGINPTLEDLKQYDPELYNNLNFLINTNDKNLKDNLDTNFTITLNKFGETITIPLKKNGENIMINYENKNEYVWLYINWFFNISINDYYSSFEKGFYSIVDRQLLKILSPQELELIICGTQKLDFNELQKSVHYECYDKDSKTIKYFWEILNEFTEEEKNKFLLFVTGCNRAPIGGLSSLPFIISRNGNINELPSSHTCFNHLVLPDYRDKELMKMKIQTALNYYEGFGFK